MKFTVSIPSLIAHTSSILLLSFSIPLVAQITDPNNSPDCQVVIPQNPNSVEDFLKIGHYQNSCLKDPQAAVSSFTQAIELNPNAEDPYYHRGNTYYDLGNYKAAVKDHTHIINQNNTGKSSFRETAYYQRARAYEKLGEKRKAISDWTEYIGDDDYLVGFEPYFRRANLYRDLGDRENAINDYKVADKILLQDLNGVNGNGLMDSGTKKTLNKVRTELSKLGVSLPEPQFETANILQKIAKMEVERALNLARLKPQHPLIRDLDTRLQDLYKQLANAEPQPLEGIEKTMISNAAYQKMEDFKKERSQLTKKFSSTYPGIILIDKEINQLEELIRRNRK